MTKANKTNDKGLSITMPDTIESWNIEDLIPYENNPRTHSDGQITQLTASMIEFGFTNPILVDKSSKEIIAGHGRLLAARRLGLQKVPVIALSHLSETKRRKLIIADNQLALNAGWDMDLLATELSALNEMGEDLDVLGFEHEFLDDILSSNLFADNTDSFGKNSNNEEAEKRELGSLVDKFGIPPFSIFEVRKGYWQKRKNQWKEAIGETGESREGTLFGADTFIAELGTVSILDPVLCEIIVSWFGLGKGTKCFDPFCGDTVFGHIASLKGCQFKGIEIRSEQVELNKEKCKKYKLNAEYICDDGQNILNHFKPNSQDLLFCCPPYFDLEVYSDLPNDASNQKTYEDFIKIVDKAMSDSIKILKENRFAAIVVSNIRNKKTGCYRNLVDDMIRLFQKNGMEFYNDIILSDSLSSAPRRAGHNMINRKVVKVHQNVLIFYKGNPKKIKEIFTEEPFVDNFNEEDFNEIEN